MVHRVTARVLRLAKPCAQEQGLSRYLTKSKIGSYLRMGPNMKPDVRILKEHGISCRHSALLSPSTCSTRRSIPQPNSVGARSGAFPDDLPSDHLQHAQSLR